MKLNSFPERSSGTVSTTSSTLLRKLREEDNLAWNIFYNKYRAMIMAIGARNNLDEEECADLVQDVMQVCLKRLKTFVYNRESGLFRSFLARIAQNLCFNVLRTKKGVPLPELPEYDDSINQQFMLEYEQFLLDQAMIRLQEQVSTECFEVFDLLEIQKRPVDEIVLITGKNRNALYAVRHRCIRKLQLIVEDFEKELSHSIKRNLAN